LRRDELEHAIRAATQIIKDDQVIIIGSQSILGSYTEDQLPAEATMSPKIDIAPMRDADADALSDQLSFDVGEWSECAAKPRTTPQDSAWTPTTYARRSSWHTAKRTSSSFEH
jgi:hypothetical protein